MKKFLEKNSDGLYFVFRVLIGVGFLLHGLMKWPGIFSGAMPIVGLMGLAAVIETVGGVLLIIGLWVRPTAVISAIEMLYAFVVAHTIGKGTINPLQNGGEAAMLYFAAFLVLMGMGARKWGIDKKSR
jgi:putative oxidoreductase